MDKLRFIDVTQGCFDFQRWLTQDALRLCGAVIDQPARDFPPIGIAAADHFSTLELTFASDDADRQQALAFARQRANCAGVQREPAGESQVIGEPLLSGIGHDKFTVSPAALRPPVT